MAHVIDDFQLESVCEHSGDFCGCHCATCEAFADNRRYHNGDDDDDDEEDDCC